MLVKTFCDKYNLNPSLLYVEVNNGTINKSVFFKPLNAKVNHIHESHFVRRKEFKKMVNLYNQDLYYYLSEHFSIPKIAKAVNEFTGIDESRITLLLYERLFAVDRSSILSTRVSDSEWAFFKYGKQVERDLSRFKGEKVFISDILDKRMEDAS